MIAQFALRLLCGMGLMWGLMPRSQVTTGFFRIQMLVALGLSVLAALTYSSHHAERDAYFRAACIGLAAVAFLGSVVWTLGRRRAGGIFVILIAAGSTGLLLAATVPMESPGTFAGWLHVFSELSSAALLGSAVTGMLLGHWYLTAPTMSIAPLSRLTLYFGAAVLARLVISAVGLSLAWPEIADRTHWLWLSLRWTAGILGPLAVFAMTWRILKYKNTQAATGVLFVGVILTFIGEMTAVLLYRELSLPL